MISHQLLQDERILIVSPTAALKSEDFESVAREVDPFISEKGPLAGLLIEAKSFPGWSDFKGLISHLKFVRDHHKKIKRVAAVTDDGFLSILPTVVNHFVSAEVKHFAHHEKAAAMKWLREPSSAESPY